MVRNLLCIAVALASLTTAAQTITFAPAKAPVAREVKADSRFSVSTAPFASIASEASLRAPGSRAGEEELTMQYSIAGNPATGLAFKGLVVGDKVSQAIEMDEAAVNKFAGNKLSAVNIYTPWYVFMGSYINPIPNVTVFLTYDLDEEPFYTQNVSLGSAGSVVAKLTLDTPYEIEAGKPFFFGYSFEMTQTAVSNSTSYIVVDLQPTDNLSGGWFNAKFNGEYAWDNLAPYYGSICISADVTGSNLPQNYVEPLELLAPISVTSGTPFEVMFTAINNGINEITSFDAELTVGTETKVESFSTGSNDGIPYNEAFQASVKTAVCSTPGVNVPVSLRITKINGEAVNKQADVTASSYINSLASGTGYDRTVVVEEGTGTWCGYCPMGISLMEYAREHYADGSLIPIAMHYDDDMAIASYQEVIQTYLSGFPSYITNRHPYYQVGFAKNFDTNKQILEQVYSEMRSFKSVADLNLGAVFADESRTSAKVTVDTEFALANDAGFRIAIVLTEDNVGPYEQNNYLSRQVADYVGYDEFVNAGSKIQIVFNDVARFISKAGGVPSSLPASVEAGKKYTYDFTLNLSGFNPDNSHVIALLVNSETGVIENAASVSISGTGAVDSAVAEGSALSVTGAAGAVVFNGEYKSASIYTTSGMLVATAAGEASVVLPAGLYVVKADDTVAKVVVR